MCCLVVNRLSKCQLTSHVSGQGKIMPLSDKMVVLWICLIQLMFLFLEISMQEIAQLLAEPRVEVLNLNLGEAERLQAGKWRNKGQQLLRKQKVGEIPVSLDLSFESCNPQLLLKLFNTCYFQLSCLIKLGLWKQINTS